MPRAIFSNIASNRHFDAPHSHANLYNSSKLHDTSSFRIDDIWFIHDFVAVLITVLISIELWVTT